MTSYSRLAEIPLTIESFELRALARTVGGGFERHATVVRLRGRQCEGIGEDVTYEATEQADFQRHGGDLALTGSFTVDGFSRHLARLDAFRRPPRHAASRNYRRWAFESAALDLALRQQRRSLADALGRATGSPRFVVSRGLGNPPTAAPLRALLERVPAVRFKLDATSGWTPALIAELAAMGAVDVIDLKGAYRDTPVDQPADAMLYRRVLEAFPEAWIEDPAFDPQTTPILADHLVRVSWDAPFHGVADLEALAHAPGALNFKPSRMGSLRALLDAWDYCRERRIPMYGGGQFELGPGRGQIQYLAALLYPDAPNDVAPVAYHDPVPGADLPPSPLPLPPRTAGFSQDAG